MPNELPSFFQDIADNSPTPVKDYSKHEDMANTFGLNDISQKIREAETEHLDQTIEDSGEFGVTSAVKRIARKGDMPHLDYNSMPLSTNIEDRREFIEPPANFDERFKGMNEHGNPLRASPEPNTDISNMANYLQTLHNAPKDQPLPTHPTETDGTLERLMGNFTASKLWEWGAYAAGNMVNPKIGPAMNATWMAAWIMAGHDLRNETLRQVREGKSISEIRYPKGGVTDLGGIISALQEKYGKKPDEVKHEVKPEEDVGAQYASAKLPGYDKRQQIEIIGPSGGTTITGKQDIVSKPTAANMNRESKQINPTPYEDALFKQSFERLVKTNKKENFHQAIREMSIGESIQHPDLPKNFYIKKTVENGQEWYSIFRKDLPKKVWASSMDINEAIKRFYPENLKF